STIESVFKLYGFMPLETPAMEQLDTLTGKYGDEGDKLLFKILNSGDYLNKFIFTYEEIDGLIKSRKLQGEVNNWLLNNNLKSWEHTKQISEKGLRYDLTVPFARFVAMNRNDIVFPFKRYQMQPVWRADRPQRGRYREFWQCDADVVGSDSLLHEADLLSIYYKVFKTLNIPVSILLNNRKLLEGFAELMGASDNFITFTVALDKLDKTSWDAVEKEMSDNGIDTSKLSQIKPLLVPAPLTLNRINEIESMIGHTAIGAKGIAEIKSVLGFLENNEALNSIVLDGTLARGLSYYTGCIVEVKPLNIIMGSLGGGGRYDNLTGNFGLKGVSGVGISFGADRIYDVLEELKLFPDENINFADILFCPMEEKGIGYCLPAAELMRKNNIKTEIYPSPAKLAKQLDYANKKGILFAAIAGDSEIENNTFMLKDLTSGEQFAASTDQILNKLSDKI
ncbi:MAG: histidine--tRNA ligase, partial [Bacteroidia bacterium]|nr:histidine--tRNA ligase [Bacteroidia bacterium]